MPLPKTSTCAALLDEGPGLPGLENKAFVAPVFVCYLCANSAKLTLSRGHSG